jgi:hypothetical protein
MYIHLSSVLVTALAHQLSATRYIAQSHRGYVIVHMVVITHVLMQYPQSGITYSYFAQDHTPS